MDFFEILNTILIGPIKLVFEIIFSIVNDRINNPGISIICLSLAINLLVLPLYMRADVMQKKARDKEKELHDGIAHIKKTFSGDERMMILQTYYKQNDYSPFSALQGSVSLLLQIPFFMAAVQVLSNIPALEGASIGPIANLGKPDGLLVIGGLTLNLLPILMTVINFVSSALFSKGYPWKTKIQLYGLAIFFLVFLYEYPSGLVFYWLLNNVFSFVKTVFYKFKNPKKVLAVLMSIIGVGLAVLACFMDGIYIKRIILCIGAGIVMQVPILWPLIEKKLHLAKKTYTPNKKLFTLGTVFLTFLMGLLIPSAVIASSPQEFMDLDAFVHPIWYIVSATCLAAGLFLVWMRIFYWLANDTAKYFFDRAVLVLSGIAIVNYLFFGTDFGNLSMALQYDDSLAISLKQMTINLVIVLIVGIILYLVAKLKVIRYVLLTIILAIGVMTVTNIVGIQKSVAYALDSSDDYIGESYFNLHKDGKNVVVIMLDRAMSTYVPYIMEERPELKEQFAGFTNYNNTISYGASTNLAVPALLGGYEYTPVEMNKRDDESLVSKHNEAHLVMPRLFSENGFDVTVSDPVYINYQWTKDLSIFKKYPEINATYTAGEFKNTDQKVAILGNNKRNFFCYSLMRSLPLAMQSIIYDGAKYNAALSDNSMSAQIVINKNEAEGYPMGFADQALVLDNLSNITDIKDGSSGSFLFFASDITHHQTLLQLPDYTIEDSVDNSEYELANQEFYELETGEKISVANSIQYQHYQVNMAAFIKIGEWLDYLRENDVYDNTRIIIVADHGYDLGQRENLILQTENGIVDLQRFAPLLMVKDFGATEFTYSDEFMTNADVPTLATQGLIENATNPFTGKEINNSEKYNGEQFVFESVEGIDYWDVNLNNGNTFLSGKWLGLTGDPSDKDNWTYYDKEQVLKGSSNK